MEENRGGIDLDKEMEVNVKDGEWRDRVRTEGQERRKSNKKREEEWIKNTYERRDRDKKSGIKEGRVRDNTEWTEREEREETGLEERNRREKGNRIRGKRKIEWILKRQKD
jgi:hypothetical protein